jgi:hypothetical protein
MFIIFGTRAKTRETGHGEFYCPSCKTTRHYIQKESANYFALYFIPLFKVDAPRVYIECQSCQNAFKAELLSMDTTRLKASAMITEAEKEIRGGTPSHIIYRKMLARGIPEDVAKSLSLALLGSSPKICKSCACLYYSQVSACSNCGGELVVNQDPAFWEQKKAADQVYARMKQ